MHAGPPCLLLLSLTLATASTASLAPDEPAAPAATSTPLPASLAAVRGRIFELLKQDAQKTTPPPPKAPPPADPITLRPPVAEDVLELDPFIVTQNRPLKIPPRLDRITLGNFF